MKNVFRQQKTKIEFFDRGNPNFPTHIHNDVEVIYIKKGRGNAFCNGEIYTLKEGDFFFVFPNQIHSYSGFDEGSDSVLLIINPDSVLGYNEIFDKKYPITPVCSDKYVSDTALTLLNLAFEEYKKCPDKKYVLSLISSFLGFLLESYELNEINATNDCTSKILQFCKQHYKEDISIKDVMSALNISRSHISHIFSEKLKISFCDYINSLRLSKSISLFDNKQYSISEIALLSGFPTIRTFNRAFAKQFNLTPSEYRKAITRKPH